MYSDGSQKAMEEPKRTRTVKPTRDKLLKRLLAQPKPSTIKKPRKPAEDPAITQRRQQEKDFIEPLRKAVQDDEFLSGTLNLAECTTDEPGSCLLMLTTKRLCSSGIFELVPRYRLVLSGDGKYFIQAFYRTVEEGTVSDPEEFKQLCEKIADSVNFKLCPGLPIEEYNEHLKVIQHDEKRVRMVDLPLQHIESPNCKQLHLGTHRMAHATRKAAEMLCSECSKLRSSLQRSVRRFEKRASKSQEQKQVQELLDQASVEHLNDLQQLLNTSASTAEQQVNTLLAT